MYCVKKKRSWKQI